MVFKIREKQIEVEDIIQNLPLSRGEKNLDGGPAISPVTPKFALDLPGDSGVPARALPDHELVVEVAQALAYRAGIKTPLIVRAYKGIITLRGQVEDEVLLAVAEQTALGLPWVKGVVNGLTVKTGPGAQKLDTSPAFSGSGSGRFQGRSVPRRGLVIQDGSEVFATDGRVGRVKGLTFWLPGMEAQDLVLKVGISFFKGWQRLPFEYVEGSYFYHNPAIYLKITRADFNLFSEKFGASRTGNKTQRSSCPLTFGKKKPVYYQAKKLGWLDGVMLERSEQDKPELSHYLVKTPDSPWPALFPVEAVEAGSKGDSLHLKPEQEELLRHPYRFNGFASPQDVVERVLEKLAWSSAMQRQGGYLRVSCKDGEVFLEGALQVQAWPDLVSIVEGIPGVLRVHTEIKPGNVI